MPGGEARLSERPLVSVLMPAYEHEAFIEQAVRSVWNQSYRPLEFLVCDDGSTDSTYQIAKDLSRESPIPMQVFRNPVNLGICKTLNRALWESSGEWIALLPSDDFYAESFIARNVEAAKALDSKLVCVHSGTHRVDEDGQPIDDEPLFLKPPAKGDAFWDIAAGDRQIIAPTLFTSRVVYDRAGGYDETLRYEDYDFHLRTSRFAKYHYIDEKHLYKRESASSMGLQTFWTKDKFVALAKHRDLDEKRIDALINGSYPRHARRCGVLGDPATARELASEYRERTGRTALPVWGGYATGYSIRVVRKVIGPGTASRFATRLKRLRRAGDEAWQRVSR